MNSSNKNVLLIVGIVLTIILVLSCLCVCVLGLIALRSFQSTWQSWPPQPSSSSVPKTPQAEIESTVAPTPSPQDPEKHLEAAMETWNTLNQTIIPDSDSIDLAMRLGGKHDVPLTLPDENAPHASGEKNAFWIMNGDSTEVSSIDATLHYTGKNIYIWIDDRVNFKESSLKTLGDVIDQEIVPTNRAFFGEEWNPGVDDDERFYILYARGIGSSIAGYYSSADEVHPDAHPYSNAHEMFLLSADNVRLEDEYILGTIAHEFQHMIHWYLDKNEEAWVNEGFSMLAEQVNGYDAGGFDLSYMYNTDMQLNDWEGGNADNSAHYGASYLFMSYYLDRFGDQATKKLVAHKENGFIAMDSVAKELNLINPDTKKPYTGIEIFADWTTANLLQNSGIEDQRYDYKSYSPYSLNLGKTLYNCPQHLENNVHQFGADYLQIQCDDVHEITFQGEPFVKILPFDKIPSGDYFWWSNASDESNMSLTRTFDLSQATGTSLLQFKAWYDIETDYDYAYLSASSDGHNWTILETKTCSSENPSGNNYGCGWTDKSNGWIDEEVDLSGFNGETVTLRFDYVTDAAVNSHGFALDDFRLEAIGYEEDFETGDGGWSGEGFVRIQNLLPQTYVVSIIHYKQKISVDHYFVDGNSPLTIQLEESPDDEKIVLIISGSTIGTRQRANYKLFFSE